MLLAHTSHPHPQSLPQSLPRPDLHPYPHPGAPSTDSVRHRPSHHYVNAIGADGDRVTDELFGARALGAHALDGADLRRSVGDEAAAPRHSVAKAAYWEARSQTLSFSPSVSHTIPLSPRLLHPTQVPETPQDDESTSPAGEIVEPSQLPYQPPSHLRSLASPSPSPSPAVPDRERPHSHLDNHGSARHPTIYGTSGLTARPSYPGARLAQGHRPPPQRSAYVPETQYSQ